jgi:hypothetical protein
MAAAAPVSFVHGANFGESDEESSATQHVQKLNKRGSFIQRMHLPKASDQKRNDVQMKNIQSVGNLLGIIRGLSTLRMRLGIASCVLSLMGLALTAITAEVCRLGYIPTEEEIANGAPSPYELDDFGCYGDCCRSRSALLSVFLGLLSAALCSRSEVTGETNNVAVLQRLSISSLSSSSSSSSPPLFLLSSLRLTIFSRSKFAKALVLPGLYITGHRITSLETICRSAPL